MLQRLYRKVRFVLSRADAPVVLSHDPRIGKLARYKASGFVGEIKEITRFSDGAEWFEIKRGPNGTGAMSYNFELVEG